ncbi:MAG: pilus assembly protein TadG-related protein [Novosphingobium sp.]
MNATPSDRFGGRPAQRSASGLLGALRRDSSGNTLAMMAAFLIPLTALAGSAVDMSRAYLVRVRLQQACDAGVLAGRKLMTVTTGTTLDDASTTPSKPAETQARAFFNNNFPSGWMQTTDVTFTPSRLSDGQVTATATATMPMAIMRMFGFNQTTQNVTCNARLDIGDSDIMFVLDTTGSMACLSSDTSGCSQTIASYTRADGTTGYYATEKTNSKIDGLRAAVLTFYDTLAANADSSAHIRYGFVPYTSTVNVGYLLPQSSLVSSWTYQSRELATDLYGTSTSSYSTTAPSSYYISSGNFNQGDVNYGTASTATTTGVTKANCMLKETRKSGSTSYAVGTWPTSGTVTRVLPVWTSTSSGTCKTYTWTVKPLWRYKPVTLDVSSYKAGNTVADPTKIDGSTTRWQGCIEERDTTVSSSFSTSSLPPDLDPDTAATSTSTQWRPMWPSVIYYRSSTPTALDSGSSSSSSSDTASTTTAANYTNMLMYNNIAKGYVSCGKSAQRLAVMTRAEVSNFVNDPDFVPQGGTYHDTGMIWGTRLISPTGPFADDTAAWPGNNPPNRYIVFMTDGDMAPNSSIYGMYGMEALDKRVTGGATSNDTSYHNARFLAECEAAKARNITIFVIGFGQTLTTELTQCATPGYAYYASDNAALETAFTNIALQVAKLRLSQ